MRRPGTIADHQRHFRAPHRDACNAEHRQPGPGANAKRVVTDTSTLSLSRADSVRTEGNGAATPLTFTVNRGGSTAGPARAKWSVTSGGIQGTLDATADDFAGGATGPVEASWFIR